MIMNKSMHRYVHESVTGSAAGPVHMKRAPRRPVSGDLDRAKRREQGLLRDPALQPCERRAETEMDTVAEIESRRDDSENRSMKRRYTRRTWHA